MPKYDAKLCDPPGPVARVTIRNKLTGSLVVDVPMLLDSGSDVSLLPEIVVKALGMETQIEPSIKLLAFDGTSRPAQTTAAMVTWMANNFVGQLMTSDQIYGILGRDILNRVVLLLDGPAENWVISNKSS